MEIYLVGGAVRDELLGRPVVERDWVVVGGSERELLDAGYTPVGKDFPVFLHPDTGEEYALARTERRIGRGHRAFDCDTKDVTLEEDLQRRDLTINAIARDPRGRLIDPVGGLADIEARTLRHVSPAFAEDPLRVLRVARFAALLAGQGFNIHPATMELMAQMIRDGELEDLTPERVQGEVAKALASASPSVFFRVLDDIGGSAVLWPALDLRGLDRLDQLSSSREGADDRLAALLFDTPLDAALSILKRYRFGRGTQAFVEISRRLGEAFTRGNALGDAAVVDGLYAGDAFRQPERFRAVIDFLEVLTGDVSAGDWWRRALAETARVERQDVASDLKGPAIGEAIRAERERRVSRLR